MATLPFIVLHSPNRSSPSCSDSDDKCPVAQETRQPTQELVDSGLYMHASVEISVEEDGNSSDSSIYPRSTTPDSGDSSGEEAWQVKEKTSRAEGSRKEKDSNDAASKEKEIFCQKYQHKVKILGKSKRHKMDNRHGSLTKTHTEKVKSGYFKSLKTKIQVKPSLTTKGSPRRTAVELSLTLDSPNKDYRYHAKMEAKLSDYKNPSGDFGWVEEEAEFDENYEVTEYQITLADRKEVEEHNSESLEIEIQVTVYACQRN